jgi:hypothetical protein
MLYISASYIYIYISVILKFSQNKWDLDWLLWLSIILLWLSIILLSL